MCVPGPLSHLRPRRQRARSAHRRPSYHPVLSEKGRGRSGFVPIQMLQIGHSSSIAACTDSDNWLDADSPHILRPAPGDPVFTPRRMATASGLSPHNSRNPHARTGLASSRCHPREDGPRFARCECEGLRPQAPGPRPQAPCLRPQASGLRPQASGLSSKTRSALRPEPWALGPRQMKGDHRARKPRVADQPARSLPRVVTRRRLATRLRQRGDPPSAHA